MHNFSADLEIVAGNPFVFVPQDILEALFERAGRTKGPIPIRGFVNRAPFQQTLVRFKGAWRLYVNMTMLPDSPRRVGERLALSIAFDPSDRTIEPHPLWVTALEKDDAARRVYDGLPPSRRKEIVRYLSHLKTDESVRRNVSRAIEFLHGNGRFIGRDSPTGP
ncbi:YdeI/OmpD-associated family protein [Rubrivirga sp. IMCC45206]|uniref:YdeI/OmpD-associated family protein n=1 Tax=Rubrivirga sp. IMCC45206 TaxID=3391614 RepID=UPI00398FC198